MGRNPGAEVVGRNELVPIYESLVSWGLVRDWLRCCGSGGQAVYSTWGCEGCSGSRGDIVNWEGKSVLGGVTLKWKVCSLMLVGAL